MKVEVNQKPINSQKATNNKTNGLGIFDKIFEKKLSNIKGNQNNKNLDVEKINISVNKVMNLIDKIKDPKNKQMIQDEFKQIIETSNMKLSGNKNAKDLSFDDLKNLISNKQTDTELKIPQKEFTKLITNLHKSLSLDSLSNDENVDINGELELLSNKNIKMKADPVKDTNEVLKTDGTSVNQNGENVLNNKGLKVYNKELNIETEPKEEKIDGPKQLHNKKDKVNELSTDPFEEIKKHRIITQDTDSKAIHSTLQETNSSWHTENVKSDQLKLSDWIDSFKEEIDKLADFRIENKQKVSMVLKEQDEVLRIIVEKKETFISVKADVTDNMKDKLDSILAQVQKEMQDKGIEVKVEIKQQKDSNQETKDGYKEESKQKQQQGGNKNGKQHNQSAR